jgi:hypothetical protein
MPPVTAPSAHDKLTTPSDEFVELDMEINGEPLDGFLVDLKEGHVHLKEGHVAHEARFAAYVAANEARFAALEALVKVGPGNTPEVEKLEKKVQRLKENAKRAAAASAVGRREQMEDKKDHVASRACAIRKDNPYVTNEQIINMLADKEKEPWPDGLKRPSGRRLADFMSILKREGRIPAAQRRKRKRK